MLHADEEVLDEDDVLLLTEVLEMCARLIQGRHRLPLSTDVLLQHLVAETQKVKGQCRWPEPLDTGLNNALDRVPLHN